MATSDDDLIDLELEYATLRKARVDLLTGKLRQSFTHTNNGQQSVTYHAANIGALDRRVRELRELIGRAKGEIPTGPWYLSV